MSGKGSRPRPYSVSQDTFASNWDKIFNKENKIQMKVEDNSDDIGRCGCGRSPTGKCVGWHALSEDDFRQKLAEYQSKEIDQSEKNK